MSFNPVRWLAILLFICIINSKLGRAHALDQAAGGGPIIPIYTDAYASQWSFTKGQNIYDINGFQLTNGARQLICVDGTDDLGGETDMCAYDSLWPTSITCTRNANSGSTWTCDSDLRWGRSMKVVCDYAQSPMSMCAARFRLTDFWLFVVVTGAAYVGVFAVLVLSIMVYKKREKRMELPSSYAKLTAQATGAKK